MPLSDKILESISEELAGADKIEKQALNVITEI